MTWPRTIAAVLVLLILFGGGKGVLPSQPVDRVVYVYEKDNGPVPRGVQVALKQLNEAGDVTGREFENDTRDADGNVPAIYKAAYEAANAAGLPELVIESQGKVLRTTEATTTDDVLEAAQ